MSNCIFGCYYWVNRRTDLFNTIYIYTYITSILKNNKENNQVVYLVELEDWVFLMVNYFSYRKNILNY